MPQDALNPRALWDRTGCPSESSHRRKPARRYRVRQRSAGRGRRLLLQLVRASAFGDRLRRIPVKHGEERVDTARPITTERQDFGCYGHGNPTIPEVSAIVGRMQTGIFDSLKESAHRQHPSPARVAAVGMMRLLWSNDILRVDSSDSQSPTHSLSTASLENLENVKGAARWPHGSSLESPYLDAAAQNHQTRNLRLWLTRFWNCLNYSRSMRLSGTPSDTTIAL